MRTISCSMSSSTRGLPTFRRALEPSNFWATSFLYQPRIVSGFCGIRHVLRRLPTQSVADLGERLLLGGGKQQATVYLVPQNSVLGNQVFIAKLQLLVHHPRDVGQDTRPIHKLSPVSVVRQERGLYGSLPTPQAKYAPRSGSETRAVQAV